MKRAQTVQKKRNRRRRYAGVPGDASTAVTEEPGVGGVDEVVASMADLGAGAAAALAVHQPTRVAEVPAPE